MLEIYPTNRDADATRTFLLAMTLIAAFVILLFLITGTWVISVLWDLGLPVDEATEMITTISAVMSGLVGAVAGYYFRVKQEGTEA